jgi:hypothetical protein
MAEYEAALSDDGYRPARRTKPRGMPPKVPPGSFVLPLDVIKAIGGGNEITGEEMIAHLFPQMLDASHARALPPHVVSDIGEGSITDGRKVLRKFIERLRAHNTRPVIDLQDLLKRVGADRLKRRLGGVHNIAVAPTADGGSVTALSINYDE